MLGGVALRTNAELPEDSSRASVPSRLHFDSFPPPFPQPLQKKIWFAITLLHSLQHHPSVESWETPSPSPVLCSQPLSRVSELLSSLVFLVCRNSRVGTEWKEMLPDLGRLGPQASQGEDLWKQMAEQEVEHDGKKNEIYLPCTKQESNLNSPNCLHSSW